MVFQREIKLTVENREVYANFDFDTGLVGFIEIVDGEEKEYHYYDSPIEFKLAFFDAFQPLFSESRHLNYKICRKNEAVMNLIRQFEKTN